MKGRLKTIRLIALIAKLRSDGPKRLMRPAKKGVPAGWEAPVYAKFDAELATALMSINAAKDVGIGDEDAVRLRNHFASVKLSPSLAVIGLENVGSRLVCHMEQDKKRQEGRTPFVPARGMGRPFIDQQVELRDIALFLDEAD